MEGTLSLIATLTTTLTAVQVFQSQNEFIWIKLTDTKRDLDETEEDAKTRLLNDAREAFGKWSEDDLIFEEEGIALIGRWTWERVHDGEEMDAPTAQRMPEELLKAF